MIAKREDVLIQIKINDLKSLKVNHLKIIELNWHKTMKYW